VLNEFEYLRAQHIGLEMNVENYQRLRTAVNQIHICDEIGNAINHFPFSLGVGVG
jgi:hypothetical protein